MIYSAECCFVKYRTLDEANRAIVAFNGRYTFPGVSSFSAIKFKMIYPLKKLLISSYSVCIYFLLAG